MPKQPRSPEETPRAVEQPSGPRFLTIKDLAERWGVTVNDAKRIVRDEKVPYLALRTPKPGSMHLCWKFMRFDLSAIEAWEDRRRKVVAPPPPPLRSPVPPGGRPILRS